jgi:hypothetical protein
VDRRVRGRSASPPFDLAPRARHDAGPHRGDHTVQYLLLIYENEAQWLAKSEADKNVELGEYMDLGKTFATEIQGGNALQPTRTATTVRVREGKTLTTDGPFAETREQLGGYYLVDAKDLDAAIAIAKKIPAVRVGSIEIRPIMKFD